MLELDEYAPHPLLVICWELGFACYHSTHATTDRLEREREREEKGERESQRKVGRACRMAYAGGAASMAAAVLGARLPSSNRTPSSSSTLLLPPRPSLLLHHHRTSFSQRLPESRRFSPLLIRASSSEETSSSVQVEEVFSDLKEKWDALENKSTVIVYGGGAIVAVWLSSIVVGAINSVPLLPKIMELVGLGYTGWFVYRYLLFKSSRKELATDIEELKKKIAGTAE